MYYIYKREAKDKDLLPMHPSSSFSSLSFYQTTPFSLTAHSLSNEYLIKRTQISDKDHFFHSLTLTSLIPHPLKSVLVQSQKVTGKIHNAKKLIEWLRRFMYAYVNGKYHHRQKTNGVSFQTKEKLSIKVRFLFSLQPLKPFQPLEIIRDKTNANLIAINTFAI